MKKQATFPTRQAANAAGFLALSQIKLEGEPVTFRDGHLVTSESLVLATVATETFKLGTNLGALFRKADIDAAQASLDEVAAL